MPDDSLRLAILIDADNASAAVIGDILSEVASLGTASVKRVYGDFTTSNLHSWRAVLLEYAIQPVQQFRNTVGKNASDSALIIDAMDLLHTRELGGFCLVSSGLYAPCHAHQRRWSSRLWFWRGEDAQILHQRLRPLHLYRDIQNESGQFFKGGSVDEVWSVARLQQ